MAHPDRYLDPFKQFHFAAVPLWLLPKISQGAALTYGLLVYHVGKNGKAWPTQETLGVALGKKPRTVNGYVAELKRHGLVEVRQRRDTSSVYWLKIHPWMEGHLRDPETAQLDRRKCPAPSKQDVARTRMRNAADRRDPVEETHEEEIQGEDTHDWRREELAEPSSESPASLPYRTKVLEFLRTFDSTYHWDRAMDAAIHDLWAQHVSVNIVLQAIGMYRSEHGRSPAGSDVATTCDQYVAACRLQNRTG